MLKWTYTLGAPDDEWDCNEQFVTKEEAIEAGREEAISRGDEYYCVGMMVPITPTPPDAERILDHAEDDMYEKAGDLFEWYPKREQIDILQARLNVLWRDWVEEFGLNELVFRIEHVEEFTC